MLKSLNCAGRRTEKPPLVERARYQPSSPASPASCRCITSDGCDAAQAVAIAIVIIVAAIDADTLCMMVIRR